MDFNHDTGTIYGGLATLDVTALSPLGSGPANILTVTGSGALTLPKGTASERPAAAGGSDIAGMFRYNTDSDTLEYFNSVTWTTLSVGGGTVTSVGVDTTTTGLTVSGSPITSSGTITVDLNSQLQGLSQLPTTTGVLVQTAAGTFTSRSIDGTAGNITVTNGDGVAGNPTINLDTVTQAATGTFSKVTLDTFGRVTGNTPVVAGDITPLVDATYVNVSGDTMDSGANLTFVGGGEVLGLPATPTGDTAATSKLYVDSVANGLSWKQAAKAASTADIDLTTGGLLTIDGYTTVAGDRIVVKDQTNSDENGIYIADSGTWVRSEDMNDTAPNEFNGAAVFVENGSTQADTAWVQTETVSTVGVDPILWVQFAGAGAYTAGNGLTLAGTVFSLTTPVDEADGGTGLDGSTAADGELLIGNGTGFSLSTLTAGTGIVVTNSAGGITIAADNTALVTSVTGTANQITATPTVGDVVLSTPATFIAPGSIQVTTTLTVDTLTPNGALYATTGGQIVSTPALTDGQILVGDTGSAPVATNITGGTGVTVTNGAGTIDISIDNTEVVTSFSAGTTGFTPVAATTGDVVLAGTLNPANGGTGLDTSSAANGEILIGNGSGLSLATLTAGTGLSVTNGSGSITLANTGVTGFSLNDNSATAIYTTAPTTTATGDVSSTITLNTQTANTIFAGPTTGAAAEPTFRTLVLDDLGSALQLYTENPATPTAPSATGDNAVAIGSGATATAEGGFAEGDGTDARIFGQKAYANGSFATAGDAQHGVYVLRNITTDNTDTELFLDGTAGTERLVLPNNSVFTFEILVVGRRTDATGGAAGYKFLGVAMKDTTNGSLSFVGTPSKTLIGETNGIWNAKISEDITNGSIMIEVSGENSKTIRWVATVLTSEVTN